jgi:hypothetical protein
MALTPAPSTIQPMSLADLTRPAVLAAIDEHDRLGRDAFLRRYGFGPVRDYRLLFDGREYPSKAIAGVAHQFTAPRAEPLTAAEFSGGRDTVKRTLERGAEGPQRDRCAHHAVMKRHATLTTAVVHRPF